MNFAVKHQELRMKICNKDPFQTQIGGSMVS